MRQVVGDYQTAKRRNLKGEQRKGERFSNKRDSDSETVYIYV